jgi:hypothetical protein
MTYAEDIKAYNEKDKVIRDFADAHPLTIPNPAYPNQPTPGPRYTITNPVKHTLHREGDTLSCIECQESVHAPSPGRRPLTAMEASLSPFD